MGKENWWDDPKNQEEIKRASWWDHEENKTFIQFPISLIKSGTGYVASTRNNKMNEFLGEELTGVAQGETKEEAIKGLFEYIRMSYHHSEDCRLNYQRWIPFRKGKWGKLGGSWFAVFGIHVYFRYGKGMKGGQYIPFTQLNVSFSNDWINYKNWKQKHKK